ncbi:MAG: aminotransferase class V-fold PLP-dependent enzyme [Acidobacteria bacterium]|nr:aminotransferase class V-fold PLP-dependent enzyme [Acidobacteriota bacterium]
MRIYLDHNATTPVDPAAAEAMARALKDLFGNASSVHYYGQQAKAAIDVARSAVAELIGAGPSEIIFTSGGTESDNFAIRGAAEAIEVTGRTHLIASGIEHEAVINTLKLLGRRGWKTTLLPLDASGIVSPERLREAMTDETALVSIMHANNEIGTIQPIAELAQIARARGALFHTDAVQSAGKIPVSVRALGVDLLSVSGHKFYGPKGVGALWVKRGVRLSPLLAGGKQERNRRAGTENVPGVIGMGAAATRGLERIGTEAARLSALRNRLEAGILSSVSNTEVNGAHEPRVPNTSNISFERIEAESLLIALDLEGVAVSTGSACSSGTLEPSHVLKAMGLSSHRAQNSIRFSLGAANTEEEIDRVIAILPKIVAKLRSLSAVGSRS